MGYTEQQISERPQNFGCLPTETLKMLQWQFSKAELITVSRVYFQTSTQLLDPGLNREALDPRTVLCGMVINRPIQNRKQNSDDPNKIEAG